MADTSHKRETPARRLPRPCVLAGSLATLATLSAVSVGILTTSPASSVLMADDAADARTAVSVTPAPEPEVELAADRGLAPLSRSAVRGTTLQEEPTALEKVMAPAAVQRAVGGADDRRWSTDDLNLWSGPSENAANVGLLEEAEKVLATGRSFAGRDEIVIDARSRWVTAGYLDEELPEPPEPEPVEPPELPEPEPVEPPELPEPEAPELPEPEAPELPEPEAPEPELPAPEGPAPEASEPELPAPEAPEREAPGPEPAEPEPQVAATGGSSSARDAGRACTNGTSVPSGVSPNIVAVHEAVCAAYPAITSYGTFRSDGEHSQGLAVDIMVSGSTGYDVADFVRANASRLGVNYIIYAQQIWSVDRAGEGWRGMEDRGSTTANHYDHVHVTTY